MKITIYELLGMIKDGKAPKKIYFLNHYYIWRENAEDYQKEDGLMLFGNSKINYILNSEVEILEEEKKIPQKLELPSFNEFKTMTPEARYVVTAKEYDVLNDIIDYLKSKGDE